MTNRKPARLGNDPFADMNWIRDTRVVSQSDIDPVETPSIRCEKPAGEILPAAIRGLVPGWIRATFIIRKEYRELLKVIAYWERRPIKEIVDEALEGYLRERAPEEFRQSAPEQDD